MQRPGRAQSWFNRLRLTGFEPARLRVAICLLAAVTASVGCSKSQQKVAGESPMDILVYDVFGQERETSYYYGIVRDSHDQERFCYQCTEDPYLVDKNIDAVSKLGHADFGRLEGQALAVSKLTEVLLEDPSALAQANAATSLTQIAFKLPRYRQTGRVEAGARLIQSLRTLDALYAPVDAAGCAVPNGTGSREQKIRVLDEIGNYRIEDLVLAKESVRPFSNRPFLIDEQDPAIRRAIDTALTKRMGNLIVIALESAVPAASPWVRADAIRGLKALTVRSAEETVLRQLDVDTKYSVQAEAVEYLGMSGSARAVARLLPMIEDPDGNLRHKARQSLKSIAGADFGIRIRTWVRWASQAYPEIDEDGFYTEPEDVEPTPDPSFDDGAASRPVYRTPAAGRSSTPPPPPPMPRTTVPTPTRTQPVMSSAGSVPPPPPPPPMPRR